MRCFQINILHLQFQEKSFDKFYSSNRNNSGYQTKKITELHLLNAHSVIFFIKVLILEIIRYVRCLLLDGIFKHIDGPLGGLDPADPCEVFGAFVAH